MSLDFRTPYPVRPVSYENRPLPLMFRTSVRSLNSGGIRQTSKCTPSLSEGFSTSMKNNHLNYPREPESFVVNKHCKGNSSVFPRRGKRVVK